MDKLIEDAVRHLNGDKQIADTDLHEGTRAFDQHMNAITAQYRQFEKTQNSIKGMPKTRKTLMKMDRQLDMFKKAISKYLYEMEY